MNLRLSILAVIALFTVALAPPIFVFSQNTADTPGATIDELNEEIAKRREKIKELEDSIDQAKKTIEQKRLQSTSLKNQTAILDNHIAEVNLQISLTQEKLAAIQLRIEQLRLQIDQHKADIEREKNLIASLFRHMQRQGGKGSIEVLASYSSFSDFYNGLHYLQMLEQRLTRSATLLREAREDLEADEETAHEQRTSYKQLEEELSEQKDKFDEQLFFKKDLLAQTQFSELAYRALLGNLRKEYQRIEGEIASIEQTVRKKLEAEKKILERISEADSIFSWPVPSHSISAFFYDPDYPYRHVFEHSGIDIRAAQGTVVRAAGSGYVAQAKRCSRASCYSYVLIIHDGGLSTVYGHLSQVSVAVDQFVTRGDIIGYSGGRPGTIGAGPFVTGPHLHFEVRRDGIPVNPVGFLAQE